MRFDAAHFSQRKVGKKQLNFQDATENLFPMGRIENAFLFCSKTQVAELTPFPRNLHKRTLYNLTYSHHHISFLFLTNIVPMWVIHMNIQKDSMRKVIINISDQGEQSTSLAETKT